MKLTKHISVCLAATLLLLGCEENPYGPTGYQPDIQKPETEKERVSVLEARLQIAVHTKNAEIGRSEQKLETTEKTYQTEHGEHRGTQERIEQA